MLAPSIAVSSPSLPVRWPVSAVLGVLLFVLVRPVAVLTHELIVVAVAAKLAALQDSAFVQTIIRSLPTDPIYTHAALALISDVQGAGVAIAGPAGSVLHHHWPSLFLPPELATDGAWASALILPGSTVVARGLSFLAADLAILALAWAAWRWALRAPLSPVRFAIAISAGALLAHVVYHHLLNASISMGDVEALGLPFAFSALFSGSPHDRPRLTSLLLSFPEPVRASILGSLLAALAVAVAITFVELVNRALHIAARALHRGGVSAAAARCRDARSSTRDLERLAVMSCALILGLSPLGTAIDADTRVLSVSAATAEAPPAPATQPLTVDLEPPPASPIAPLAAPVKVSFEGGGFHHRYLVDGTPTVIKGMGYNVRYSSLPLETRIALYDRDFTLMRQVGVNTVFGWETHEFDRIVLDRAWAAGLGVAPPFDLRPDLDYTDPALRASLRADVLAWVTEYKDHPAVRMWAVGNEVLHKLVFPSWMSVQDDEWHEARARAFADFLMELVDEIHALDPHHPIIHRDAEDAYVRHVREAFTRDGVSRPWFSYGVNAYTPRLADIIEQWPNVGFDAPLFVSEFAPGGLGSHDRPTGLREMWDVIQDAGDRVIGGAIYVWSTDGPEEVDRVFGLVDPDGVPVDDALDAVADMYADRDGTTAGDVTTGATTLPDRIREHVRVAIATAQEADHSVDAWENDPSPIRRFVGRVAGTPVRDDEIDVARLSEPRTSNELLDETRSWWVTWSPSTQPQSRLAFLVEEDAEGVLHLTYACRGA